MRMIVNTLPGPLPNIARTVMGFGPPDHASHSFPCIMSNMKIYSWNVNGIRAVHKKGLFLQFLQAHEPDILCLQETKAERGQVKIALPNTCEYWNSAVKKGYSETAIFSKHEPLKTINGFPHDFAKRFS